MSQMKELYEKVAKDQELQRKFNQILAEGEKEGKAVTEEKLVAFAKDAGFTVSLDEMQEFFKGLEEKNRGELSDVELDQVAGGKSDQGVRNILTSVFTLGFMCMINSIANEVDGTGCGKHFG